MFNLQLSRRLVVRFLTAFVVLAAALPLSGALAGDTKAVIEVELVDRWETTEGRQVRGRMIVQLRLRQGDNLRPLAHAGVTFESVTGAKGARATFQSNAHGMVQLDASYAEAERGKAAMQLIDVHHQAVPPGTTVKQSFAFHGDPLPALFVYDQGNARIQKLTLDGSFIMAWGSEGAGPGQFCPGAFNGDLALDSSSNVYVIDGCQRVQKFNGNGDFLTQWGSAGDAPGQFGNTVLGIFVDATDHVYVSSSNRIQRFDSDGNFQMLISTAGQVLKPYDIAIDTGGDLWVSDHNWVYEYAATGEYLGSVYLGAINDNFLIGEDDTFYASSGFTVHKVSSDGSLSEFWGPIYGGTGIGEFKMPESFALDGELLYVLERSNGRVQILTTDGAYTGTFGTNGSGAGQFDSPTDIAIHN